jgi:hypothetical protein
VCGICQTYFWDKSKISLDDVKVFFWDVSNIFSKYMLELVKHMSEMCQTLAYFARVYPIVPSDFQSPHSKANLSYLITVQPCKYHPDHLLWDGAFLPLLSTIVLALTGSTSLSAEAAVMTFRQAVDDP